MRILLVMLVCFLLAGCGTSSDSTVVPLEPTDALLDHDALYLEAGDEKLADASAEGSSEASPDAPDASEVVPEAAADTIAEGPVGWAPFGFVTLNLHCLKLDGTTFPSNQARLQAVADTIYAQGVQVIAVQEACVAGGFDAIEVLRAALSQTTNTAWSKHWVFAHKAWEGTPDEADEGVGILARGSLSDPQALEHWQQGGLHRVAASAVVDPSLGGFLVTSVHLEQLQEAARVSQARQVASQAIAAADPSVDVLIAGDFNDVAGGTAYDALPAFGYRDLSASIPADMIDHVFSHRGAHGSATGASTIFDGTLGPHVSDHRGVLVHLTPATGESLTVTRFRAAFDPGSGHVLTLRGNTPPLDWTAGWVGASASPGDWKLVVTEIQQGSPIEYKWLIDDATWQTGGNASTSGGADALITPAF